MVEFEIKSKLTDEKILQALKKKLPYKVEKWKFLFPATSIEKNLIIGAAVKIKAVEKNKTTIAIQGNPPSIPMRLVLLIFGVIIGLLVAMLLSNKFADEIADQVKKTLTALK